MFSDGLWFDEEILIKNLTFGYFFGREFENNMKSYVDYVQKMKDGLNC